jgi:arsenate reductase-like glutaredoxin family protein
MRFYGLKTCDTCRKALMALRAAGHDPVVMDVRADGIGADDLAAIVAAHGDAAVNRASTTWRGLPEEERARPVADQIARHPTLMKRPAIAVDGVWTLGWDKAVQARLTG